MLKKLIKNHQSKKSQNQQKIQSQTMKRLNKLQNQQLKKLEKEIYKSQVGYNKARLNYINFLKNNNQWDEELEKKYNPKKINNRFVMDKFDEDFAVRYARSKLFAAKNKFKLKKHTHKFGNEKEETFIFYYELMKVIEKICRVNNWTKREDWIKHGLNMNDLFKKYILASIGYADIRKYYSKKDFDKRRALHTK